MTISEAPRYDDDRQREFLDQLEQSEGAASRRGNPLGELKAALEGYAALEDKYLKSELTQVDMTIERALHRFAEHEGLDERGH